MKRVVPGLCLLLLVAAAGWSQDVSEVGLLQRVGRNYEPDRQEMREILKESSEWEYRLHLMRVEAELDIRAVVGDHTWSRIVQARDRMRARRPPQGPPGQ